MVESTYNWYWLVDGLMDNGYTCAHLANPAAIKQYEGSKQSDDQHAAFFLAQLLILGILPQGYIYPKTDRPVRDLARKRMFLVQPKQINIQIPAISRERSPIPDLFDEKKMSIYAFDVYRKIN